MLNMLIVDDMPVITDGLYELFREELKQTIEVYKAYSAPEALELLHKTRMDIIVSDIKMPEISGLELLKEINIQWPHCKVIFLTSYHDFDFAKEAVSLGGFDFILKTEGDNRILQAVNKAAEEIIQEQEAKQLVNKAQAQYKLAQPTLQKEFLHELLQGMHVNETIRLEQFRALEIPFNPSIPVFLAVSRMDGWRQAMSWSDKALLQYSIKNIMDEYLSTKIRMVTFPFDSLHIVVLWQPQCNDHNEKEYNRAFRFFYGSLETIQNTCLNLLKLQTSFVASSSPVAWDRIGEKLHTLEMLLQEGIGLNRELLTTDTELKGNSSKQTDFKSEQVEPSVFFRMERYSLLPGLLANGKNTDFFELYEDLLSTMKQAGDAPGLKLEVIHFLAFTFLGYINRRQLLPALSENFEMDKLLIMDENPDWESYAQYFLKLSKFLLEHISHEQESRSNRLVQDIQQFIVDNLHEDLSLTRLGSEVYLNPTYLSRLYKQITGNGLSEYIMEARLRKAKELLENSDKKIHEIAKDIGYQSGIAFTRFFKKMMNVTPQDYREMQIER